MTKKNVRDGHRYLKPVQKRLNAKNRSLKPSTSDASCDEDRTCCTEGGIDSCDMFDFMSNVVGMKILHPGGVRATRDLLERLDIDRNKKVLDIACGKGRTSVHLAKEYGCKVVGVDILENSIEEAKRYAKKNGMDHLVSFRVADAHRLPFSKNEFDVTLAQAMLILVDDKAKVIREAIRVLKPGGRSGWLELSWKKRPTRDFLDAATKEICAACIAKVETFEDWEKLFRKGGAKRLETQRFEMEPRGMKQMIENEGIINSLKVMFKSTTRPAIRRRMNRLNRFFRSYPEFTSYGIYIGSK
jgi:ubiquinone/menaquinone biosynthesis C-methylase UbiE